MDNNEKLKPMAQAIRHHLGEMFHGTVEEALNAMLEAEADSLCGTGRYERSKGRKDTKAGIQEF